MAQPLAREVLHGRVEAPLELDGLRQHANRTVEAAAKSLLKRTDALPNSRYSMPEKSPNAEARGKGRAVDFSNTLVLMTSNLCQDGEFESRRDEDEEELHWVAT